MYSHLQAFITWDSAHSDKFNVLNGVRQGSVLSRILFGYYMEELIEIIVKRNIGGKIGDFLLEFWYICRRYSVVSPTTSCLTTNGRYL